MYADRGFGPLSLGVKSSPNFIAGKIYIVILLLEGHIDLIK